MIFNNIFGEINSVHLSSYENLISTYINKAKLVKGVKSIIQIGGFTAPGLSDIDLIVIVDDHDPPKFEDISIKKLLNGCVGSEVIAHDVFIYPESLAKYIEGLFYLDRKVLLFGNDIGMHLSQKKIEDLKLIISFEYIVNRLETLIVLTAVPKTNIRDILLFISTLRHTYGLLNTFEIISEKECAERIEKIEKLRRLSLDNNTKEFKKELNRWIIPSFIAIYQSILQLGNKLNYKDKIKAKKKILNYKKLIFIIDDIKEATTFFIENENKNKMFKARILIEPMPSTVFNHINCYRNIKLDLNIGYDDLDTLSLRYYLANRHKDFLKQHKYPIASSYIIIDNRLPSEQDKIKNILLKCISILPIFK